MLSYTGSRLLRQSDKSLWNMICAFLDQDNFPSDTRFVATLSTVVMIGIFSSWHMQVSLVEAIILC